MISYDPLSQKGIVRLIYKLWLTLFSSLACNHCFFNGLKKMDSWILSIPTAALINAQLFPGNARKTGIFKRGKKIATKPR